MKKKAPEPVAKKAEKNFRAAVVSAPLMKKVEKKAEKVEKKVEKQAEKKVEEKAVEKVEQKTDESTESEESSEDSSEDNNEEAVDESEEEAASFVQVKASTKKASVSMPGWLAKKSAASNAAVAPDAESLSMLGSLQQELFTLKQEDKSSLKKLKHIFKGKLKALNTKKAQILQKQEELKKQKSELEHKQKLLNNSLTYLKKTKNNLSSKLNSFGNYLKQLSEVSFAAVKAEGMAVKRTDVAVGKVEDVKIQ